MYELSAILRSMLMEIRSANDLPINEVNRYLEGLQLWAESVPASLLLPNKVEKGYRPQRTGAYTERDNLANVRSLPQ